MMYGMLWYAITNENQMLCTEITMLSYEIPVPWNEIKIPGYVKGDVLKGMPEVTVNCIRDM